jgi:selenocysteine lyase/cysteine desulfurase
MSSINLAKHFEKFRSGIIGQHEEIQTVYGIKPLIYADWVASGRLYMPIEQNLLQNYAPFIANTHTEATFTGALMTKAYHDSKNNIKAHVGARESDAIIPCGTGMTGALAKLQRILGYRCPEQLRPLLNLENVERPIVFLTHMEHHSNQTPWLESVCEVVIINPDSNGLPDLNHFSDLIKKYNERKIKIASITACSNVTGVVTPYHKMAEMIHLAGGVCFVDFACSAPYVEINMHPEEELQKLDAITFSPHKFLGGPGTPGILIFDSKLYANKIPDQPGGGTVKWTNPWGEHSYIDSVEDREDGGTPPFYQTIKASLAMDLKKELNPELMAMREHQLFEKLFTAFSNLDDVYILANNIQERVAAFSFYIKDLHYNLGVRMLNDIFGIQVRGGCSCAGTYGHFLFDIPYEKSHSICELIDRGDNSEKPGWIRLSVHPTMTDAEMDYIIEAIHDVRLNFKKYRDHYVYNNAQNQFYHEKEMAR